MSVGLMSGVGAAAKPLAQITAKASKKIIDKAFVKIMMNKGMRDLIIKILKIILQKNTKLSCIYNHSVCKIPSLLDFILYTFDPEKK